jgi:hypothetical protein
MLNCSPGTSWEECHDLPLLRKGKEKSRYGTSSLAGNYPPKWHNQSGISGFLEAGMTLVQSRNIDVVNNRSEAIKPAFRTLIIRGIELVNDSICYGYFVFAR